MKAPTDRLAEIEAMLRRRCVSPEIVARVVRLNADTQPGHRLRGIHYSNFDDPRWMCGAATRGEIMRRYGRAALEALPADHKFRRGRRQYVTLRAVMALAESQQPKAKD